MAWTPYSTENSMSCTLVILSSMFELNLDMGSAQHEVTDLSSCWQFEYNYWTTVWVQWKFHAQVWPIALHHNDITKEGLTKEGMFITWLCTEIYRDRKIVIQEWFKQYELCSIMHEKTFFMLWSLILTVWFPTVFVWSN